MVILRRPLSTGPWKPVCGLTRATTTLWSGPAAGGAGGGERSGDGRRGHRGLGGGGKGRGGGRGESVLVMQRAGGGGARVFGGGGDVRGAGRGAGWGGQRRLGTLVKKTPCW